LILESIKSEGLAHNSYFVGGNSAAAVIDPRRDADVYVERARQHGLPLRHIIETHRHEDFVSGARELAALTGATIYHGLRPDWRHGQVVTEGQVLELGSLQLNIMLTPGHTDESISVTLSDATAPRVALVLFSGDNLFAGETGRTDFYGPAETGRLSGNLHDSIFNRYLPLGEKVILCPAHGAGSVCGSHISDSALSTLGLEKQTNPQLKMSRADFIRAKTTEVLEHSPYFHRMEKMNTGETPPLPYLPQPMPLNPKTFAKAMSEGAVVVDVSNPAAFAARHLPGAINISLDLLSSWGGWVLPYDRPLLLVPPYDNLLEHAVRYLVRVGFENFAGYLSGGTESWLQSGQPTGAMRLINMSELAREKAAVPGLWILDSRMKKEWAEGHLPGAFNIPLGQIKERLEEIPRDGPVAVYCGSGRRAVIAASIIRQSGRENVSLVLGGPNLWKQAGLPLEK